MEINEIVKTDIGDLVIEGISTNISLRFKDCKVNGVHYRASLLVINKNKTWKICDSKEAYFKRLDGSKEATQIAISKILEIAKISALNWIENNPEKIVMAEIENNFSQINHIKNEISSKKEEIYNLERDLADLVKTSQNLVIELDNLKGQK